MAKCHDTIHSILGKTLHFALLSACFRHRLAQRDIKPPQSAQLAATDEQIVVRQEIDHHRLIVLTHAVKLNTLIIVNMKVLALSSCKHCLVLHKTDIPNLVLGLKLTKQVLLLPVKKGEVAFATSKDQVFAIFGCVDGVGAEVCELEIENVVGVLHRQDLLQVVLCYFERPFALMLRLDEASRLSVEKLVVLLKPRTRLILQ